LHLFGELFLAEILHQRVEPLDRTACTLSLGIRDNEPICPEENLLASIFFLVYKIFVVIMMINILIAVFTSTYERIMSKSNVRWASDRFEIFVSGCHMLPFGFLTPVVQFFLIIWAPIALLLGKNTQLKELVNVIYTSSLGSSRSW
jgi:hypothetical protein